MLLNIMVGLTLFFATVTFALTLLGAYYRFRIWLLDRPARADQP